MEGEGRLPADAPGDVADASTLGGQEWPVDDHYYVEPAPEPAETEVVQGGGDEAGAVAAAPIAAPPFAARGPRPALVLLAVVLVALLLAAGLGAWLLFRPGSNNNASSSSSGPPASSGAGTQPTTSSSSTTTATSSTTTTRKAALTVPDTLGMTLADARARLSHAGLRVRVRRESSDAPADQVLRQSPGPGANLERNALVVLTVSSGPARVSVPALVGLAADAAAQKLRSLGLVPQIHLAASKRRAGSVLAQDPAAGERVTRSSTVRLQVAKQAPKPTPTVVRVSVPDLVGLSASTARRELAAEGLEAEVVRVTSDQEQGTVVRQSPAAGAQVHKGTSVRLSVSSGSAQVAVPSVVGLDQQSAESQLQQAGFEVRVVTEPTTDPSEDGTVTAQDPEGGKAADGSTVTITVGQLSG